MSKSTRNSNAGASSLNEQEELHMAPECPDQHYVDSLMECFQLFTEEEASLINKAQAQGLDTDGMSHEDIASALYRRG